MLFGGDLGRYGRPVLPDPSPVAEADVLLVESTYGDRVARGRRRRREAGAASSIDTAAARRQGDHSGVRARPRRGAAVLDQRLEDAHADSRAAGLRGQPDGGGRARDVSQARSTSWIPNMARTGAGRAGARRARQLCAFCTAQLEGRSRRFPNRARCRSRRAGDRDLVERHGDRRPRAASPARTRCRIRATPCCSAGYQAAGTRGRLLKDGAKFTRIHGRGRAGARARSRRSTRCPRTPTPTRSCAGSAGSSAPPALTCLVHGEPGPMDVLKARIERELGWTVKTPASSGEDRIADVTRTYLLEQVDDAAVVQYYADGFDALPLDQKVLSGTCIRRRWPAATSTTTSATATRSRCARCSKRSSTHPAARSQPETLAEIRRYTKLFWINSGSAQQHDVAQVRARSARRTRLREAARCRRERRRALPARGRRVAGRRCSSACAARSSIRSVDPLVTSKTPGQGRDILQREREQPLRRRHDGRPRRVRGAVRPEFAAGEARRPARSRRSTGSAAGTARQIRDDRPPSAGGAAVRAAPMRRALEALIRVLRDRRGRRPRGVRRRLGRRQGLAGRHDQRLHRELPRRARREGRVGRHRLLREPREDRKPAAAGRGRAVVRGAHALGSEVAPLGRRRRHRARHRRRRRDRRGGADDGDRDQSAERSAHSRGARQQVGVAREHQRGVRQVAAAGVSARVLLVRGGSRARGEVGRASRARSTTAIHEVLGPRIRPRGASISTASRSSR